MLTRYVIMYSDGSYLAASDDYTRNEWTGEIEKARLILNPQAAQMMSKCIINTKVVEVTFSPTLMREMTDEEFNCKRVYDYRKEA